MNIFYKVVYQTHQVKNKLCNESKEMVLRLQPDPKAIDAKIQELDLFNFSLQRSKIKFWRCVASRKMLFMHENYFPLFLQR